MAKLHKPQDLPYHAQRIAALLHKECINMMAVAMFNELPQEFNNAYKHIASAVTELRKINKKEVSNG